MTQFLTPLAVLSLVACPVPASSDCREIAKLTNLDPKPYWPGAFPGFGGTVVVSGEHVLLGPHGVLNALARARLVATDRASHNFFGCDLAKGPWWTTRVT
jgi:hypothetical protein